MRRPFSIFLLLVSVSLAPAARTPALPAVEEVPVEARDLEDLLPAPPLLVELPRHLADAEEPLVEMPVGRETLFWRSGEEGEPEFLDVAPDREQGLLREALSIRRLGET